MLKSWFLNTFIITSLVIPLFGCNQETTPTTPAVDTTESVDQIRKRPRPTATTTPTPTPSPSPTATQSPTPVPSVTADALIFWGAGANDSNAQSLVDIVKSKGLSYVIANSEQINSMTLAQLASYKVFVWPGGDSNVMNESLTANARLNLRKAVMNYGVNYSGFCAGAWFAVGPDPGFSAPIWGLSLLIGDYLKQYYPYGTNPTAAILPISFADGTSRSLVWWGGPILPATTGGVIAKYPDGSPAFTQGWAGKGYVTITGVHPEAPQSWRTGQGLVDPDGLDYDIAAAMIQAAINKTAMRAF